MPDLAGQVAVALGRADMPIALDQWAFGGTGSPHRTGPPPASPGVGEQPVSPLPVAAIVFHEDTLLHPRALSLAGVELGWTCVIWATV
jgi:hypothetical protein